MESQDQFAPNCALLLSTNETDCSTSTLLVEFSFNLLVLLVIIIWLLLCALRKHLPHIVRSSSDPAPLRTFITCPAGHAAVLLSSTTRRLGMLVAEGNFCFRKPDRVSRSFIIFWTLAASVFRSAVGLVSLMTKSNVMILSAWLPTLRLEFEPQ